MRRQIGALALAMMVWAAPAAAQEAIETPAPPERATTIKLEHYFEYETAADPQASPDGSQIVYTRRRVDAMTDGFVNELWIMDATGARARFLGEGSAPEWSKDGGRLAFLRAVDGKSQIFVRFMDAEGAVSQITHHGESVKDFAWSPDGRSLAFRAESKIDPAIKIELPARPKGAKWTEDPLVTNRLHYRIDRQGLKSGFDHLYVVPSDGGAARALTSGAWEVGARFSGVGSGGFDWTPDSRAIVFDGVLSAKLESQSRRSGIHRVDVASGRITTLLDDGGNWADPKVSPNGQVIAFSGHPASEVNYPASSLRVMNADGGNVRVLRPDLPDEVGAPTWSRDGRTLYYTMNYRGETQINAVDLRGNNRVVTSGQHRLSLGSIANDGSAAVTHTAPQSTLNVGRVNLRTGDLRLLTNLNADIFEGVTLGKVEEINYRSPDGTPVQGWIVYPPNFDAAKRYPLLLEIHGGPHAMYGVNFAFQFQEWASAGYVVLYTNPRGSTGYTPEFANAIDNEYPGPKDYSDLMAGVDAVLARGFIDEKRLYVAGCSGGGVLTAWIVAQTDRFAAAASLCPVTNWISFTGTADVSGWAFERFRPNYWEDPKRWLDHSPIMHAHKVKTPTLLMTGVKDLRTPLHQAEEFYANLKRRGVPSVLIAMNEEYHGTSSKPSNLMRTHLYLRSWFEQHGGGAKAPEEAKKAPGVAN